MYINGQTIVAAAAIIAAVAAMVGYYNKAFTWIKKQDEQDTEIQAVKEEQQILTYGILACLKGLKEQGCNGPVTEAINKIEKHLNIEAHK